MLLISFYKLTLLLSLMLIFSLSNWFVVWCCMELMTALLILLMSQEGSPRSVEAVSKYFVAQAVASAFILLGIVLQFSFKGSTEIFYKYSGVSYIFLVMGLFVKLAVIPKPFWFVDTMSGLNLIQGFYVVVASKMIPIYLFMNLCSLQAGTFLSFVGIFSVALGSILGLNQTKMRKIVAYSSIAHLGWFVLSFPYLEVGECIFIFCCYLLMVVPFLWVASYYQLNDMSSLKKVYEAPQVSFFIILSLLSLGGFPPLVGFFYKWMIFLGLLKSSNYLLCSFLIFFSLVSLFFYLRLCFNLYSLYWSELKLLSLSRVMNVKGSEVSWFMINVLVVSIIFSFTCFGPLWA